MKLLTFVLPVWYSLFTAYTGYASEWVHDYTRQSGVYVSPYQRTEPSTFGGSNSYNSYYSAPKPSDHYQNGSDNVRHSDPLNRYGK